MRSLFLSFPLSPSLYFSRFLSLHFSVALSPFLVTSFFNFHQTLLLVFHSFHCSVMLFIFCRLFILSNSGHLENKQQFSELPLRVLNSKSDLIARKKC